MYRCRECGEVFDEPNYIEVCWESYNGVASMFRDRHYGTIAECPACGEGIDTEWDSYDEDDDEEWYED